MSESLRAAAREIRDHLENGIIPFWARRAYDPENGGYLTRFDGDGRSSGTPEKYLNTQCRLLWWFSTLARSGRDRDVNLWLATQGFEFIRRHFWDKTHGGWFWKVSANGLCVDDGKVVYGQSFATYALAEYALASGSEDARTLAVETFDQLQKRCARPAPRRRCRRRSPSPARRPRRWRAPSRRAARAAARPPPPSRPRARSAGRWRGRCRSRRR
jgi:mannobiose 2-epimerase